MQVLLEKQLVLKGIMTPEDFAKIRNQIRYDFIKDNYFEELKQAEILRERMQTLSEVEEYKGTYFSKVWIQKNVLQMTDEDIDEINDEIELEGGDEDDDLDLDDIDMDFDPKDSPKNEKQVLSSLDIEESQKKLLDSMAKFIDSE